MAMDMANMLPVVGPILSRDFAAVCTQIQNIFPNTTITPDQATYLPTAHENWSQTAWMTPSCIFQPTIAHDLEIVIPMLVQADVSFAIRSGGHMPAPGFANIDNGVLIDMSKLTTLQYDAGNSAVTVGSGNRWVDVYTYLDPFAVTVAGGRVNDVGVAGLTLGCGLSYLSDLYGLVCDNVVNYEVILGSGALVNASAKSNSDLFWALKGGANNFGIVTAFTFTTFPINQVWGGLRVYAWENFPGILEAMEVYQSVPNKDPYANLNLQGFPLNASLGIVMSMVYLKPEAEPAAFAPFSKFTPLVDTVTIQSIKDYIGAYPVPDLTRVDWFVTSFKPSKSIYQTIGQLLNVSGSSNLVQLQSLTAGSAAFGLQPISISAIEAGIQRGGNALGLTPVNQTWFHNDAGWWFANDDTKARDTIKSITAEIETATKAEDSYLPYLFMNDASESQDVIAHYGAENVGKLKAVQAKYDPKGVFQKLVPGGFKLG